MKRLKRGIAVILSLLMIFTAYPIVSVDAAPVYDSTVTEGDSTSDDYYIQYDGVDYRDPAVDESALYYKGGDSALSCRIGINNFPAGLDKDSVNIIYVNGADQQSVTAVGGFGSWADDSTFQFMNERVPALSGGHFEIRSLDGATTYYTGTHTIYIDAEAPSVTLSKAKQPDGTYTVSAEMSDDCGIKFDASTSILEVFDAEDNEITLATYSTTELSSFHWDLYNGGEANFTKDGRYSVGITARDWLGNETTKNVSFTIDNNAPVVNAVVQTSLGTKLLNAITFGLFKATATVNVTATDVASAISSVEYKVVPDGTDPSTVAYAAVTGGSFTVVPEFKGVIYIKATDASGNVKEIVSNDASTFSANDSFKQDTDDADIGGVIVDSIAPEIDASGTFNTPEATVADVRYYSEDQGSATYTISASDANFDPDNSSVTLEDADGNNMNAKADSAPAWTYNSETGKYDTTVTVSCKSDHTNDGKYRVHLIANDVIGDLDTTGGHTVDTYSPYFVIDTTYPAYQYNGTFANYDNVIGSTYYFTDDDNAVFTASFKDVNFNPSLDKSEVFLTKDVHSSPINLESVGATATWTQDESDASLYKVEVTVPTNVTPEHNNDGEYTLMVSAVDYAGHYVGTPTFQFVIDTTDPVVEISFNDVDSESADDYVNTDQSVKVTVTDDNFNPSVSNTIYATATAKDADENNNSDLADAITIPLATSANWTETSTGVWENTSVTLSADAHYSIQLTAYDLAKNDGIKSASICVDKTAPEIAVTYNDIDSASKAYYNNTDQAVKVSVTEENFDSNGITATVTAKDVNGNTLSDVDVAAIKDALEDSANWSRDTTQTGFVWVNTAVTLSDEANYDITIDAVDLAGNDATDFTDSICVDKTAPTVTVTVRETIGSRILEAITFGLYNADATATVIAKDDISPVTEVTYEGNLADGVSPTNTAISKTIDAKSASDYIDGDKGKVSTTFAVNAHFYGYLVVTATDSAANTATVDSKTTAISAKSDDRNYNVKGVIVDNAPPVVTGTLSTETATIDGVPYYGQNTTAVFTIDVEDVNFIKEESTIVVKKEGETVTGFTSEWTDNGTDKYQATVTVPANGNDGLYTVDVTAKDILAQADATHSVSLPTTTFVIDTYAPVVTDFDFQTSGAYYVKDTEDGSLDDQPEATKTDVMQYDYYFQEATTVTVNATDKKGGTDYVSGIRDVVLITCDYTSGSEVWSQVALTALDASAENADVSLSGTINGPFKGSIYAFVIDRLDQYPTTTDAAGVTVDQKIATLSAAGETFAESIGAKKDGFVSPNDSVIEDDAKHGETSSIGITLNTKTSNTEMSKDSYVGTGDFNAKINDRIGDAQQDSTMSTAKDVPLYNKNVSVTLDVKDEYSGIRQIDWYVLGRDGQDSGNNQSGTLTVDNEGAANGDDGWTAPKDGASNLVYSATKDITVSNNSNDIIVLVVLTDRAGNKSYDYTVLGIDKTAPVINVSYSDNNVRTGNYDSYYNHDRTVTVTVKERNFDAAKVVATIANTDSSYSYTPNIKNITSLSAWSSNGDANDPTYTYKITYTNDGTFKFDIKVTDRAGNSASKSEKAFTIDKTAPEITVSLSNSDVQRTKYFKADRTATITVKEHNFNAAEFENLIKATLNGSGITVPSISSWSRSGDNNTATVTFSAEGDYELSFKYEDMAGNKDATTDSDFSGVSPVRFTIDKTNPTLTISGVKDKTAYSTVPAISVSESDNNCYLITVILTGYTDPTSNEATEKFERTTDADHLRSLILELTAIADDGFYKISATGEDMAGNKSETSELTFTKNEHGSVLIPSSDLKELIGGYWNKDNVQDKSLYIDEYSLVPITESEYYININGKAQSAEYMNWVVVNDSPENGWYHYRYTIDESLITAEGEYTVYIRSTVHNNGDPEDVNITNNDADAEGGNRLEVSFNIDNTNPYIEIKGLEKHVNNRTTEKEVSLTVNESHLNYIYVVVREAGTTDETGVIEKHLWVNDTTDRNSYIGIIESLGLNEADVQVDSYVSETEDLPTATFTLDIDNAEKQDVEIRVADLAGNIASEDEDYNKPDIFTDISSSSREDNISSDANGIALKFISLSKTYAIGQMIKDNKGIAIGILIALLAIIAIAIIIPVAIKKRKALALEEAALDDDEDEEE